MRNFEEQKAEVFRRSEERIRARAKIRSRVIAACVPLILCAAAIAAVTLPGANGEGEVILASRPQLNPESIPGTEAPQTATEALNEGLVQVSMGSQQRTFFDADTVRAVTGILNGLSSPLPANPDREDTVGDFSTGMSPSAAGTFCTITVRTGKGSSVYILSGTYLKAERSGLIYQLSQKELQELNALLGISRHETE